MGIERLAQLSANFFQQIQNRQRFTAGHIVHLTGNTFRMGGETVEKLKTYSREALERVSQKSLYLQRVGPSEAEVVY